jgi:precorrin-6Y C5,15-methyltransferase (decarboxylating)
MTARITVVGAHGGQYYGEGATRALAEAPVLVGSVRHLQFVEVGSRCDVIEMAGGLHGVLDRIATHIDAERDVAVISSGDPGFFGIVRLLGERFGRDRLVVHPAPSSVALAFARIGATWDDAVIISAHGRPADAAIAAVIDHPKVAVLTAPLQPPQSLGHLLVEALCEHRDVVVATRLGEPDEHVVHTDLVGLAAGTFDPMSVVVFLDPTAAPAETPSLSWGLPEREFAHRDGMITKSEVRAVALGKLDLPATGVLWDIGAGSGSVAIECARLRPRLRVVALERDAVDAERIRDNAKTHGVAVTVVTGSAPAALDDLPTPDRVFIGGGGIAVLDACLLRLRPGGTVVATHVLVDRASESWRRLGNLVQLSVAKGQPIADGVRLEAQNPVFITWGPDA